MTSELVKFDQVRADIAHYKTENANLVFDYEDSQGNKDARSHIYKLRQTKTKIAEIHKIAKAEALGVCRLLDQEKRTLTADVDEMIDVHYKPVKEIEEREVKKAAEKANADRLEAIRVEAERTAERERREEELAAKEAAMQEKEAALIREQEKLETAKQAEIDKAIAVNQAQRQAEQERIAAIAKAEQDKKDAIAQAEFEKRKAVEAEKERQRKEAEAIQSEKDRLDEIEAKRVADQAHRDKVEYEVAGGIVAITKSEELAAKIVAAIMSGKIPHITILY